MANVYGNPINTETLEGMPEYVGKKIRRIDRAHVAFNMENAGNKNQEAVNHVNRLKAEYGNGASTLCLVYNATGDTIEYVTDNSWYGGNIWKDPYPQRIANGQWGAFLHVHPTAQAYGSIGAVVYRAKNADDKDFDTVFAWSVPWGSSPNTAFTFVGRAGYTDLGGAWENIEKSLYISGKHKTNENNGGLSTVSIGGGSSPTFVATLTLPGAKDAKPTDQ